MYKCPSALPNVWYIALIDHTGSNQRITSKPHKVKVKILTLRDYPGSISRSVTHGWFTPTLTIITEGNSNSGLALWVNIWNPASLWDLNTWSQLPNKKPHKIQVNMWNWYHLDSETTERAPETTLGQYVISRATIYWQSQHLKSSSEDTRHWVNIWNPHHKMYQSSGKCLKLPPKDTKSIKSI